MDKITACWIQTFMSKNNIVGRAQTGKLMVSQERQDHLEKEIAHHLGLVGREFQCGSINEDMVVNWDEPHFVINMDNGKMLGFRGDNDVKYANDGLADRRATCSIHDFSKPKLQLSYPRSTWWCTWCMLSHFKERIHDHASVRRVDERKAISKCPNAERSGEAYLGWQQLGP